MIDNCIWLNFSFILFTMKLNTVKKHNSVQNGIFEGSRNIYSAHALPTSFIVTNSRIFS